MDDDGQDVTRPRPVCLLEQGALIAGVAPQVGYENELRSPKPSNESEASPRAHIVAATPDRAARDFEPAVIVA